jgi:hypothetical protein
VDDKRQVRGILAAFPAKNMVHVADYPMRTLAVIAHLSLMIALPSCSSSNSSGPIAVTQGGSSQNSGSSTTGGSSSNSKSTNAGGSSSGGATSASKGGETQIGSTAAGGSSAQSSNGTKSTAGGSSSSTRGGASSTGGNSSSGGTFSPSGASSNKGGSSSSTSSGAVPANGGQSFAGSSSTTAGGATTAGGTTTVGTAGSVAASGASGTRVDYELAPPDQCHDVDQLPWSNDPTTGCVEGNTASKCGGKCKTASVCEDTSSKPNADVEYMCPRNLLFSPEMEQAALDDGYEGFHYAVVGHDPDQGGIDGNAHSCCQCYQLVYAYPSPSNDRQAQVNPDNPTPPASAIPIPPPLIVQSFNTAATATTFDVYMPAGGMGANNGCYPVNGSPSAGTSKYMYTSYPSDGQPGNGGVKPASLYQECKTATSWVTEASLSADACVKRTTDACNKLASDIPGLTDEARTNCLKANTVDTFYHLNWSVYAMRVECPEHLTRVTGCRLAKQTGVNPPKKDVTTAAQAAKDPDFWSKTAHTNNLYETTTMEDCCRPTCASYSQISNFGLTTDPQYRSFYNCNSKGVPWTQSE